MGEFGYDKNKNLPLVLVPSLAACLCKQLQLLASSPIAEAAYTGSGVPPLDTTARR